MKDANDWNKMDRRKMLKTTALAASGVVLSSLPSVKAAGANDRLHVAIIGLGNHGTGWVRHVHGHSDAWNTRLVAVCDVFRKRVSRAQEICGDNVDGYTDYRKILERPDVDLVVIVTPDHWHAKMAMDAIHAGKHVHLEKPMTLTIDQAIELRNVARKSDRILHVGSDYVSSDQYWQAHQAIKQGRIGKVTWAKASFNRNSRDCAFNAEPFIPEAGVGPQATGENHVDWDMWLGHEWGLAPKIPWNPEHFYRFRKYWAYSGGVATDLMYHKLAPLLLAIAGPDGEYPRYVSAAGGLAIEKDGRDIPDTHIMTLDYPSEFTIFLISTLTNDTQISETIYGKHGTMDLYKVRTEDGDLLALRSNGGFGEEFLKANGGVSEATIEREARHGEFESTLGAIRGECVVNCNPELGAAAMVGIKMGVDAYRQRKTLHWDTQKEKVVS